MKVCTKNYHQLIQADIFEGLSLISNNSIDLIFIDPPYNIGKNFNGIKDLKPEKEYLQWSYQWIDESIKKLKSNGSLYLMASTQFMPYFDIYIRDKITVMSRIVWYYDSSSIQAKKYFGSLYEPILFCVKNKKDYCFNTNDILIEAKTGAIRKLINYRKNPPKIYNSKKVPGNVWEYPRVRFKMKEYKNHPTQKPVALLERIIKASSNEHDTILDLFSGTFTTAYVCKQLNRKSISIEINEKYVDIGLQRIS
jgi:site-specific DNA-methyltransferase (adenine-specific)